LNAAATLIGGTTTSYLNIAAFHNPAAYAYGNTPRTMAYGLRGPTFFNQSLSVKRQFTLYEKLKLTLQADSINPFNNVSFPARATVLHRRRLSTGSLAGQQPAGSAIRSQAHLLKVMQDRSPRVAASARASTVRERSELCRQCRVAYAMPRA